MGTNTDPYQPAEGRYRLTRGLVEVLSSCRNPFSILTKSSHDPARPRPAGGGRGADARCASRSRSAPTTTRSARLTEPGAAPPSKRLEAVARLAEAGLRPSVLVAPVLPGHLATPRSSCGGGPGLRRGRRRSAPRRDPAAPAPRCPRALPGLAGGASGRSWSTSTWPATRARLPARGPTVERVRRDRQAKPSAGASSTVRVSPRRSRKRRSWETTSRCRRTRQAPPPAARSPPGRGGWWARRAIRKFVPRAVSSASSARLRSPGDSSTTGRSTSLGLQAVLGEQRAGAPGRQPDCAGQEGLDQRRAAAAARCAPGRCCR